KLELAVGQFELDAVPYDPARHPVQLEVVGVQDKVSVGEVTAQQDAQPGHQLGERKGLHQIIVCPAVQSPDAILDSVACREDQNRLAEALRPQVLEHLQAVSLRQHQIQDNDIG